MSSNSPKKWTNEFVVVVKTNLFVRFLGGFEDTKSPFEIIWPLSKCQNHKEDAANFCGLLKEAELYLSQALTHSSLYYRRKHTNEFQSNQTYNK